MDSRLDRRAGEKRAGIPAQREAIRRIAQEHEIVIAAEHHFELTDISGARILFSPVYQQFLRTLENPEITAVVTKEFSRLMRPERFEDYAVLQHFADNAITLYMPDSVIDLSNRQSKFFAGIRAGMAGLERLEIRQRMMDAKEAMRRQGRHPSAEHTLARGLGYNKKTAGWYYDEGELQSVRLLFKLFLEGSHNYEQLSKATGIPRTSVPVILRNPVYAGTMVYHSRHDLSPAGAYPSKEGGRLYRRKIPRSNEDVIQVALPLEPVITHEQHDYIVSILDRKRHSTTSRRGKHGDRFVYRGYLRCGSCQQPVYTHVNDLCKDFYYCLRELRSSALQRLLLLPEQKPSRSR